MIEPAGGSDYIAYGVTAGGYLLALGQMAWSRFFSREGRANDALVAQLGERIASQEARLVALEAGLDDERSKRRDAEDKVHALEMYVVGLQAELRRHGIEVPPQRVPTVTGSMNM